MDPWHPHQWWLAKLNDFSGKISPSIPFHQSYRAGCGSAARCCRATGILLIVDIIILKKSFPNNQIMGEKWDKYGMKRGILFLVLLLFKLDACFEECGWRKLTMDGIPTLDSLVGIFRGVKWSSLNWAMIPLYLLSDGDSDSCNLNKWNSY